MRQGMRRHFFSSINEIMISESKNSRIHIYALVYRFASWACSGGCVPNFRDMHERVCAGPFPTIQTLGPKKLLKRVCAKVCAGWANIRIGEGMHIKDGDMHHCMHQWICEGMRHFMHRTGFEWNKYHFGFVRVCAKVCAGPCPLTLWILPSPTNFVDRTTNRRQHPQMARYGW